MMERAALRLIDGPPPAIDPTLGPCLLWQGSKTKDGYGQIITTATRRGPRLYVHRLVWMVEHGPVPAGYEIHHRCEVTPCARLAHLACVTHRENILATARGASYLHSLKVVCGVCGCPYDHVDSRGRRVCTSCRKRRQKEYRNRKRAAGFVQDPVTRLWVTP